MRRVPQNGRVAVFAILIGIAVSPARLAGQSQTASPGAADAARQPTASVRKGSSAPTVRAVRGSIRLDGRLDEAIYTTTEAIGSFVQQEPDETAPATEKTEAWVFFDDDMIYVAARCWESRPERRVANEMRRDANQLRQNDTFAVLFDTFHDRRNGYLFTANAIGGMGDSQITDEGPPNVDWNTVWRFETSEFDGGWTVEMAIPFKSLRYQPGREQTWVGYQPAPGRPVEERVVISRPGAARADHVSGHPEGLVGRDADRPGGAIRHPDARTEAIRAVGPGHRHDCDAPPLE
jgi:hypothetical protein